MSEQTKGKLLEYVGKDALLGLSLYLMFSGENRIAENLTAGAVLLGVGVVVLFFRTYLKTK